MIYGILGTGFYTIPCGVVPKDTAPYGRIIHDYSFAVDNENSFFTELLENSVIFSHLLLE